MNNYEIRKLADLLVKANYDIGYGDYECHGEYHSYKKSLTKRKIAAIIRKFLKESK